MEVEFTARQVKISKALRAHAEEGMERIGRILGKTAHASITFSAQRHVQIVELNGAGPRTEDCGHGQGEYAGVGAEGSDGSRGESGAAFPRPADCEQAAAEGRKGHDRASGSPAQGASHAFGRASRKRRPAAQGARVNSRSTLFRPSRLWWNRTS